MPGIIEGQIEAALANGKDNTCTCEACGDPKCEVYRVDGEAAPEGIVTYCDDCADELSHLLTPSSDYHGRR